MNIHAYRNGSRSAIMALAIGCLVSANITNADDNGGPLLIEFALGLPGKQVKLNWSSEPGVRYHVEKSTSLGTSGGAAGGWARVAMIEATGPSVEWRDPQAVTQRCFYRVTKPRAEVFSITPPVLESTGGILVVRGQCLPVGSMIELLDDSGAVVGSFSLTEVSAGLWQAAITGSFSGSHYSARVVTPGSGPQGSPVPLTVTQSGLAPDSPGLLPPAAPVPNAKQGLNGINQTKRQTLFNLGLKGKVALPPGPGDDCDDGNDFEPLGMAINDKGLYPPPRDTKTPKKKTNTGAHRIIPPSSGLPGEASFHFDALSLPCPAGPALSWMMTYRSSLPISSAHGPQWDFSYNISIEPQPATSGSSAPRIVVRDGGGRADVFHRQADGTYRCDGLHRQGSFAGDTFTLTFADTGRWVFMPLDGSPAAGKIASIIDRNNVALTCDYTPATDQIASVSDVFGRSLTVNWDASSTTPRISSVADSTGRTVHFTAYSSLETGGTEGTLKSISCAEIAGTPPEGAPTVFTYTTGHPDPNLNNNLLSITDGAGRVLEACTYHPTTDQRSVEYDRCASHDRSDGHVTVLKSSLNSSGGYTLYQVDELGRLTETDCDKLHRVVSIRQFTGFCTPGTPADATTNRPSGKLRPTDPDFFETQYAWNPDHALVQATDPDGSQLRFVHEREMNPGCPVIERGNVRSVTMRSAVGDTRNVSFEYQPGFGTLESARPGGPITGKMIKCGRNPGGDIVPQGRVASGAPEDDADCDGTLESARGGPVKGVLIKIGRDGGQQRLASGGFGDDSDLSDASIAVTTPKLTQGATFGERMHSGLHSAGSSVMELVSGRGRVRIGSSGAIAGTITTTGRHAPPVTRVITGHGQEISCAYDAHGNLVSYTTPIAGSGASYQYDTLGRCTSVSITDGTNSFVTNFAYHPDSGLLTSVIEDPSGLAITTQYEHDPVGRCIREVDPEGFDTLYEYRPSGLLSRCESPLIGSSRIATTFHYDPACRLVRCDLEHRLADGSLHPTNSAYSTFCVYDSRARLVRIAEEERPVAVTTELTPDSLGIGNFAVCDFTINPACEITRVSTPAACRGSTDDLVCNYQYDERGLLYRCIQGGLGSTSSVVNQTDYSPVGLPVRSACLVGGVPFSELHCDYDGFHRLSSVTDPMGNVAQFSYDSRGRITTEVYGEPIDAPGSAGNVLLSRSTSTTTFPTLETAPYGLSAQRFPKVTGAMKSLFLTSLGRSNSIELIQPVSAPDGIAMAYPSSACRSLFHSWETRDDTMTEERFVAGSTAPPVIETTTITRSPAGLVKQVSRNGDTLATYSHDTAGRTIGCSNGAGSMNQSLDLRGKVTGKVKSLNSSVPFTPNKLFTTTHQYDSLGREIQTTDSSGNTLTKTYDSLGRPHTAVAAFACTAGYTYDGESSAGPYSQRVATDLDGDGTPEIVTYSLHRCGEWKSSTDPQGYVTTATHDALGRLSRIDHPEGTYETFSYDARGLHHQSRSMDGTTCDIEHDLNGRATSISHSGSPATVLPVPPTACAYDGLGRQVSLVQGTSQLGFAWDSLGACVSQTQDGVTVNSSYNHRGRTGLLTSAQLHIAENRDSLGRVLSVSLANATGPLSPPVASFEHLGMHLSRIVSGNGVSTAYTYRGYGDPATSGDQTFGMRPVRCLVTNSLGTVLSDSRITRDTHQLATSITTRFSDDPAGPGRLLSLTRDTLGRVTGWSNSRRDAVGAPPVVENTVTHSLDSRGMRIETTGGPYTGTYTQSPALPPGDAQRGLYTTWPGGTIEWDENHRLTRIPYHELTHVIQQDARGRIVSITDESTGNPIAQCSYDALDRLVTLTVHGGTVPHFTRFIYDGSVCIQELGGDGVADLTHVVSGGIRHCISTRNGTILYPHSSQAYVGPCDASSLITSATGAVVEHRTCDGDGRPLFLTPAGLPSSTGVSVIPIRWMAPESLWLLETRLFHSSGGAVSPNLGTVVSKPIKIKAKNVVRFKAGSELSAKL